MEGGPWGRAALPPANRDDSGGWPNPARAEAQMQAPPEQHWRSRDRPGPSSPASAERPQRPPPAVARQMFSRAAGAGDGQRSSSSSLTEGGVGPPVAAPYWTPGRQPLGQMPPHLPRPFHFSSVPRAPSSLRPPSARPIKLGLSLNICDDLLEEVNCVLTGTPTKSRSTVASGGGGGSVIDKKGGSCQAASADSKAAIKKSAKLSVQPGKDGKVKASNFNGHSLTIGSWRCRSRNAGDLVAKVYFAKKKLVWEVLEGERKKKIEFQWADICAMRVLIPEKGNDVWEIDITCPPTFHREMPPQPKKHTLWEACSDFTNGQASTELTHRIVFPNGTLQWHYDRLMEFDPRLEKMMEESGHPEAEPDLDSSATQQDATVSADPQSFQELRYREPPAMEPMHTMLRMPQSSQPFFHMPGYSSQFPRVPLDQMPNCTPSNSLDGLPPHMQGHHPQGGASTHPSFADWVRGRSLASRGDAMAQMYQQQQQMTHQQPLHSPAAKRQRTIGAEVQHSYMPDEQQQWMPQDMRMQQSPYSQAMYSGCN